MNALFVQSFAAGKIRLKRQLAIARLARRGKFKGGRRAVGDFNQGHFRIERRGSGAFEGILNKCAPAVVGVGKQFIADAQRVIVFPRWQGQLISSLPWVQGCF